MKFTKFTTTATLGIASLFALTACHHSRVTNPIAKLDSKQPDKVLFDRAEDAIHKGQYDVARSLLQTMINTYPDSEFIARAKLGIADSWYAEGNTAAYTQAEREYKDFEAFFPNMPEAAEAQMKIANIHYSQMQKPGRDYTEARRAEDEYRQMITQYPDSKLLPQAKERLREVQEIIAEGQFDIARFYYLREAWPAAIARLRSLADEYPLFSHADETLWLLGQANEREMEISGKIRGVREVSKKRLEDKFRADAVDAYGRITSRYPAGDFADNAANRLKSLDAAVPRATAQMVAQNKAEIASRHNVSMPSRVMDNFRRRPETTQTTRVGDPSLQDVHEASAPEISQSASKILRGEDTGTAKVSASVVGSDATSAPTKTEQTQPLTPPPPDATPTAPAQPAAPSFENVPDSGATPPSNAPTESGKPQATTNGLPQTQANPTGAPASDAATTAPPSASTPQNPPTSSGPPKN